MINIWKTNENKQLIECFILNSLFCSVVLLCTMIGTSLEAWEMYFEETNKPGKSCKWSNFCNTLFYKIFLTVFRTFFLNFGLYGNVSNLMDTSPPKGDHLGCLDGIRFLSMTWVYMGHFFGQILEYPLTNLYWIYKTILYSYLMDAVRNAFVSVDSFFLISGTLVTYLMLKELDRNRRVNFPMMYLHRYLR